MSKIKFIYFDVGEVLVQGMRTRHVAEFLGIPYEQFRPVFKKYQHDALINKMSAEEFFDHLKKDLSLQTKETNYPKMLVEHVTPHQEVQHFFQEITKTHKVGFITNLFPGIFAEMQKNGLVPQANERVVVGSWQEGVAKPHKQLFVIAQEKTGVKPNEILLIDDNEENVQAAQDLGWQAIVFDPGNPVESIQEIKKLL